MATLSWDEVRLAEEEKRRELVLSGKEISERIQSKGLDEGIFSLELLNFLEISDTCLDSVPENLGNLSNLTSLILRGNKLTCLPSTLGNLQSLKTLDVSNNELLSLPDEFTQLKTLHTCDISINKLTELPSKMGEMDRLTVINVSRNMLEEFPVEFFNPSMLHLSEVKAKDNNISILSPDIAELPALKVLDLSNNKLETLPAEIADCPKLKETDFKQNRFKDRRLGKMVEQCPTKSVLDYVQKHVQRSNPASKGKGGGTVEGGKGGKKKKGKKGGAHNVEEKLMEEVIRVLHISEGDAVEVHMTNNIGDIRPYIVCCIVRDYNLDQGNTFKKFITAQTKLHDTLCQKRTLATIATHDLSLVKSPLYYDALLPTQIALTPLGKKKDITADKLVKQLWEEAEALRKEKKRNTVSGIHKYLELVKDCPKYPCVLDKDGQVISFPPITNCDPTKISKNTTNIFIEVTSSSNQEICKKVLDSLLKQMLDILKTESSQGDSSKVKGDDLEGSGVGAEGTSEKAGRELVVQQVRVLDDSSNLKVVYPSRTDLSLDLVSVIRNA
ncbi:leucine-rich repeat-containing protein 47-like [Glandiceps talaboti]